MKHVWMAALFVAVLTPFTSRAVTGGQPDGDQHPYVGMIVVNARAADGTTVGWRCSGTLIAAQVVVTAAHCAVFPGYEVFRARIWLYEDAGAAGAPATNGREGVLIAHPLYSPTVFDDPSRKDPNSIHDFAVLLLDEPVTDRGYARLPWLGMLDGLDTQRGLVKPVFTMVGYGRQQTQPYVINVRQRYKASSQLLGLGNARADGAAVHLSGNDGNGVMAGEDPGGIAPGDSGGPLFLGGFDSDLMVAITSFGTAPADGGPFYGLRLDTEDAQWFLGQFLTAF